MNFSYFTFKPIWTWFYDFLSYYLCVPLYWFHKGLLFFLLLPKKKAMIFSLMVQWWLADVWLIVFASVLCESFSKWLSWWGEDYYKERESWVEDQLLRRETSNTIIGHSQPPNSHEESVNTGLKLTIAYFLSVADTTFFSLDFCWVYLSGSWATCSRAEGRYCTQCVRHWWAS